MNILKSQNTDYFIKKYPLIFKKYRTLKKMATGAFSEIYSGINILNKEKIAIKIEKRNIINKYLESECYTLFSLRNIGIPRVLSFGHNKEYDILIMPLLGKSLLDIFISKNLNYEFKDICLIAIQIIERIQWIHSRYIVHRDIKPDNFLIGLDDPHILYLIDFGLSKKYQSTKTGKHIKMCELKKFTGSIVYASVNSLKCREQSRRDDLESIGYMLIYLMKGSLPWQRVKVSNKKESYLKVAQLKNNIKPEKLCENLPNEFITYLKYVKKLKFEEEPNYNYLRNIFVQMMRKQGFEAINCFFSWVDLNNINIRYIKRQISQTRRSCSRTRVINKIKKVLENSKKSYSENKNNNEKNNNDNLIYNENNNKLNRNTKVKKCIDKKYTNQKKYYFNTDINTFGRANTKEKYNERNKNKNNNLKISIKKSVNNISNNNTLKISNKYTPLVLSQEDIKKNITCKLSDNNINDTKVNYNYNNDLNNPVLFEQSIKNNIRKINAYKNKSKIIENNHKRVSSINNFQNTKNILINNKTFDNNIIGNKKTFMFKKKRNIIVINNHIYPINSLSYKNTLDTNKKNYFIYKNINNNLKSQQIEKSDNNLRKIKLFNIFSPKKKKQSETFQNNNISNYINKNKELMDEINIFNKRYNNNENFFSNKSGYDVTNKKLKVPKINFMVRSSDNKRNKTKKSNNFSPNNNCNVF